ncbi:MAG: DNA polymerase III subunit delta [Lachnospiraceae bacterium]|nr:DNA polymerase III subunit delta [Lachnospiraceae bacterium]
MAAKKEKEVNNGMQIINSHIESGSFSNLYLLTGEEKYLILQYRDKLVEALIDKTDTMNYSLFRDESISEDEIISIAQTMPFFAERRVIVVEESGFFAKKTDDAFVTAMSDIPETTVIIFVESKTDGKLKLYNIFSQNGIIARFDAPDSRTLIRWIQGLFREDEISIEEGAILRLLENTGSNMNRIYTEVEKLKAYGYETKKITLADVNALSADVVEDKIFEMIEEISKKNKARVLKLYDDLKYLKTDAMSILALTTNQYNRLLKTSEAMGDGNDVRKVATVLKSPDWLAKKYIGLCRNYNTKMLVEKVNMCIDTDNSIKKGRMKKDLAVEMLILNLIK